MQQPKNILVIKLGALGDFIGALGTMGAIRKRYPSAHITLLTTQPFVKMAEQSGYFNKVQIDLKPKFNPVAWFKTTTFLADNYDLIFNIQLSKRVQKKYYTVARLWASQPLNWANAAPGGGFNVIHIPAKRRLTWGKSTSSFIDLPWVTSDLTFMRGEQKHFNELPKKYVLVIPGCSPQHPDKRWPMEQYVDLVKCLDKAGIPAVILGTKSESTEIDFISTAAPSTVNFMDKASLMDIPALAMKSLAIVGNDTGPAHMAALCQKPTVMVFCNRTAAYGNKSSHVTNFASQNIADISVATVFNELMNKMKIKE